MPAPHSTAVSAGRVLPERPFAKCMPLISKARNLTQICNSPFTLDRHSLSSRSWRRIESETTILFLSSPATITGLHSSCYSIKIQVCCCGNCASQSRRWASIQCKEFDGVKVPLKVTITRPRTQLNIQLDQVSQNTQVDDA